MTQLHLKLLLHHYTHVEPWEGEAQKFEEELRMEGLLKIPLPDSDVGPYQVTERGYAHLQQILSLPLPEPAWINANGAVIQLTPH